MESGVSRAPGTGKGAFQVTRRCGFWRHALVLVVPGILLVVPAAEGVERHQAGGEAVQSIQRDEFRLEPEVFEVKDGQRISITSVPMIESGGLARFDLERFQVFATNSKIVVHTAEGDLYQEIPRNLYFKGRISDDPHSIVVMSVLEDGVVRGIVSRASRFWVFEGDAINRMGASTIRIRAIEAAVELEHDAQGFQCTADDLQPPPPDERFEQTEGQRRVSPLNAAYTARIAVETDNEFFNKFGNATDAANYVADIIAFGSVIYSGEVNTSWFLQFLSLWAPGSTDPWAQNSPDCGLFEFGRYWNDNHSGISRTLAHFMSGKTINAGIAWVGALCYPAFDVAQSCPGLLPATDNYGGAYGYSGGMDGNFDFDNPAVVWDIVAVTHEIGHNFNSPHTHCYAGLGGSGSQIDQCYSGEVQPGFTCYSGTTSLPSGCPGGGHGCGTLMSYCHSLTGGLGNIALTLGEGHPYGIQPDRVPDRMFAYVQSRAGIPGCLDYVAVDDIFADGFESNNTSAWSTIFPPP